MSEVWAAWLERDSVAVEGPDALAFLQGQLSQDLDGMDVGEGRWSFILQPQGKVDALVRVVREDEDSYVLDVDDGFGSAVESRLSRFKLRTKCEISSVQRRYLAVRGTGSIEAPGVAAVASGWTTPGLDLVGSDFAVPDGIAVRDAVQLEEARIIAGFPRMGPELDESTIPAESGLVPLAVSFTKGCFTGQELVARIDSRGGNVPRHLRRVTIMGHRVPAGAELTSGDGSVGKITSAAWSEQRGATVGLAYVKRSVDAPTTLFVAGPGDAEAQIEPIT